MSIDWEKAAKDFFDEQPHPRGHGLKIKEVLPAVKLASMAKFGGHASLHEAALFWGEFAPGGVPIMAPDEFEHALDNIAPASFVFHGRPPTLSEIVNLKDKTPAEVHRHFGDLPHRIYPDVSAANMVKAVQAAGPWAQQHLQREPTLNEARYLHHSGEHPSAYYERIAAQNTPEQGNGLPTEVGRDGGEGGMAAVGGQAPRK